MQIVVQNGDIEEAIRRLKKSVMKSGILSEVRQWAEKGWKPSERKKTKQERAKVPRKRKESRQRRFENG
jgi:ribosomal protein S21